MRFPHPISLWLIVPVLALIVSGCSSDSGSDDDNDDSGGSTNAAPTAEAGDDVRVREDGGGTATILLDGTGSSDSDGSIASYSWDAGSGGTATGDTASLDLGVGNYTVVLTVTDDGGMTATDSMTITVLSSVVGGSAAEYSGNYSYTVDSSSLSTVPRGLTRLLTINDSGELVTDGGNVALTVATTTVSATDSGTTWTFTRANDGLVDLTVTTGSGTYSTDEVNLVASVDLDTAGDYEYDLSSGETATLSIDATNYSATVGVPETLIAMAEGDGGEILASQHNRTAVVQLVPISTAECIGINVDEADSNSLIRVTVYLNSPEDTSTYDPSLPFGEVVGVEIEIINSLDVDDTDTTSLASDTSTVPSPNNPSDASGITFGSDSANWGTHPIGNMPAMMAFTPATDPALIDEILTTSTSEVTAFGQTFTAVVLTVDYDAHFPEFAGEQFILARGSQGNIYEVGYKGADSASPTYYDEPALLMPAVLNEGTSWVFTGDGLEFIKVLSSDTETPSGITDCIALEWTNLGPDSEVQYWKYGQGFVYFVDQEDSFTYASARFTGTLPTFDDTSADFSTAAIPGIATDFDMIDIETITTDSGTVTDTGTERVRYDTGTVSWFGQDIACVIETEIDETFSAYWAKDTAGNLYILGETFEDYQWDEELGQEVKTMVTELFTDAKIVPASPAVGDTWRIESWNETATVVATDATTPTMGFTGCLHLRFQWDDEEPENNYSENGTANVYFHPQHGLLEIEEAFSFDDNGTVGTGTETEYRAVLPPTFDGNSGTFTGVQTGTWVFAEDSNSHVDGLNFITVGTETVTATAETITYQGASIATQKMTFDFGDGYESFWLAEDTDGNIFELQVAGQDDSGTYSEVYDIPILALPATPTVGLAWPLMYPHEYKVIVDTNATSNGGATGSVEIEIRHPYSTPDADYEVNWMSHASGFVGWRYIGPDFADEGYPQN